jgi:hypothetical protein
MTTDRVERLGWIRDDTCRREERESEEKNAAVGRDKATLFLFVF